MTKRTKPIADALTQARVVLGLCIALLGFWRGRQALPQVILAVIVSWATDLLDGPLARHDPRRVQTWIGEHDAEADLSTSVGLTAYLMSSRYLTAWLGIAILLATLGLWFLHSHQLAWPFYAMPYAILISVALRTATLLGWALIAYLAGVLLLRWRRLKCEFLPEFLEAAKDVYTALSNRD